MNKIINDPKNYVREMMEGICLAHPDQVKMLDDDFRVLVRSEPAPDKVGIVTAGGSGHLPLFLGYVGEGMLDGCAVGDVFASPSAEKMTKMIKACDTGKGVLLLFGNYGGDKMNFAMAREEAEFEDIEIAELHGADDVASAALDKKETRRGVAGIVYAYKIAGAAADAGYDLHQVEAVTARALDQIRTMGVALTPCIVPTVGKPTFTIEEGKMEIGMGIHGEAGIDVSDILSADEVADLTFQRINEELKLQKGDHVSIMVNGLGATPLDEQYIVYRRLALTAEEMGLKVILPHIGEYATSMEMSGLSVSVIKLDEELENLLKAPARTPFYTNANM